ncbi:SGNH/GDSL hydrolase family protein [Subtercola sp. PAMC28395]|uniref:SGNH/GDSL hydrolase family protein n=1 Tax=Subtercola sp. PAMC28395 TaxID=2846775 RepID=UPI001C0CEBB9|nr:SGNH/GDSL hydrolase family protein [Subtercola sp. PAMC28395]QWT23101.1 SGNH/GDSL hydrolase family protein [Subtercola sp. PAMC28395]
MRSPGGETSRAKGRRGRRVLWAGLAGGALLASGLLLVDGIVVSGDSQVTTPSTPPALPVGAGAQPTDVGHGREPGAVPSTVVAIGDSIMDGHGVGETDSWPALLAQSGRWQLQNLASDGTGFVTVGDDGETFADQAVVAEGLNPSIVIVAASSNDLGQDDSAVQSTADSVFQRLRTALPLAKIVAVSAAWGSTPLPEQLVRFNQIVSDASASVGGAYIDIGQLFLDHPELMQADDTHPTVDGQNLLAETIGRQLTVDQIAAIP